MAVKQKKTRKAEMSPTDTGQGGLYTSAGAPVPLLGVRYQGRLEGSALDLVVSHRFRNDEPTAIEAVYTFPLPEEGVVHGLTVRIGDRVIRARAEEREKAFETYDQALVEGHGAFLLDQERPNVFVLSVGAILPGVEAVVETALTVPVRVSGRELRLALPTTISPRYGRTDTDPAARAEWERVEPPYAAAVPYGLTLDLEIRAAEPIRLVESPSHPLRVELNGNTARVALGSGVAAMDRELVLRLELGTAPQAAAWASMLEGRDHCRLEFSPVVEAALEEKPRPLAFLVDCSGSMGGDSIREARRAVEICLRALREGEHFRILRFGSRQDDLTGGWRTLDQPSLDEVAARLRDMQADLGGTEILEALRKAVRNLPGAEADLVVLTDGQVSDEEGVLNFVRQHKDQVRVFSFGIGAGCSDFLVRGMSRESGGEAEFIFPGERIEPKVLRQFGRLRQPRITEIAVDWAGRQVEAAPSVCPPLFSGDAWCALARLAEGQTLRDGDRVRVSGRTAAGPLVWEAEVRRVSDGGAVPVLWARERLRDLEEHFGVPGASRQRRNSDQRRSQALKLSETYGVLCSLTSLVAVEERAEGEKAAGPLELRRVPAALTRGWGGMGAMEPLMVNASLAPVADATGICESAHRPSLAQRTLAGDAAETLSVRLFEKSEKSTLRPFLAQRTLACDAGETLFQRLSEKSEKWRFLLESLSMGEMPLPEEAEPWYLRLLSEQRADGSFPLSEILAEGAGKPLPELQRWAGDAGLAGPDALRLLATALALLLLARLAPDRGEEWRPAAKKACRFLAGQETLPYSGLLLTAWLEQRLG